MDNPELTKRLIRVKTYHPTMGDSLIEAIVTARVDRPLTDPFFASVATKLAKKHGKVVEWKVHETIN